MNFIHKPLMSGIAICLTFFAYSCATPEKMENKTDFTAYVDPYIGSGEHGHVFVGANVPFGAVQVGPQNIFKGWDWCSGYHYSDSIIIGFSHTHLSGTGCSDLGDILLMPYTGEVRTARGEQDNIEGAASSYYKHANEAVAPGYYSLLMDNGVKAELTATERVALHRYTYPSGSEHRLLINLKEGIGDKAYDTYLKKIDEYTIEGYRFSKGWSPRHKVFFTLKCDQPIESLAVFNDDEAAGNDELTGESVKGVITFKGDAPTALVKVAISSVSCENALANLRTELSHWDFDEVRNEAIDKWNDQLSCISIDTKDERAKKIFYTAMYHAFIAPTLYCDANGDFRGHDDKVYTNNTWKNYSTFSLWDTYRAAHPLFTYTEPERVNDMVKSFIAFYEQNGRLPVWNFYGSETDMMIGYHAVPVIVDAYLKGIGNFDAEKALNACVATANLDNYRGIGLYKKLGYIPYNVTDHYNAENWSLSKTLEYAFDDYCIAEMAKKMGKQDIAETFYKRSQNYKNVYNPATSFMQPRDDKGTFIKDFKADDYTPHICESNGWQYFWSVQHDVDGLINLVGGKNRFAEKLDSMFTYHPAADAELPLFSTGMIGQYAHGNEPSHHVIYLFNSIGFSDRTQYYVAKVMNELYKNEPAGLCGNEDCGQMSAWYVFSAMGFYPVNPVSGKYEIGTPLFPEMQLHLANGKIFTVLAPNVNKKNIYIQSIKVNGQPYDKTYLTHEQIMGGATVEFEMGETPKAIGVIFEEKNP